MTEEVKTAQEGHTTHCVELLAVTYMTEWLRCCGGLPQKTSQGTIGTTQ